jgi:hypothetical protein
MESGQPFNPYMTLIGCIVPNAILHNKTLLPIAKLCYARLVQYAGRDGRCFPSLSTLAEELGVERRHIRNIVKSLEDHGFIRRVYRKREDGSSASNEFEFLWHDSFSKIEGCSISEKGKRLGGPVGPTPVSTTDPTPLGTVDPPNEVNHKSLRESLEEGKDVSNETSVEAVASMNKSSLLEGKRTPLLLKRRDSSPIEFIREDVAEIIAYWNASPDLPHHKAPGNGNGSVNTKTLTKMVREIGEVIDGKFLTGWPPYSKEDIIKSIESFKVKLFDLDYYPADKSKLKTVGLSTFFWNQFFNSNQSVFKYCLEKPPQLIKNIAPKAEEKKPQLTKWLIKLYTDRVLLGQPKTFNQVEINKFVRGANLLSDSIEPLRKRANLTTGPYEFCECVVEALIKNWGRAEVKVGNIGSEWTYTDLLPRYLKDSGRID